MTYFEDRLADYDRIHRNPINRVLHAVGIPTIQLGVLGLLGLVKGPSPMVNGATALIAVGFIIMARYSIRAAIAQTIFASLVAYTAFVISDSQPMLVSFAIFGAAFVVGWMLQFAGHAFERQSPEFVRTPLNLLIGPLFVLNEVFRILPNIASSQRS